MKAMPHWMARAWLPYTLAGVLQVSFGAVVLGDPRGLGLVFIGLTCLGLGLSGAVWRVHHGYGLVRNFSRDSR